MNDEELLVRLKRVRSKVRAMEHACIAFASATSQDQEESAVQACLNAGREFSWVAKAQLQSVVGAETWPAVWAEATKYLRDDPLAHFLFRIRNAATHEGILEVVDDFFTVIPKDKTETEFLTENAVDGVVSLEVRSFLVFPTAPEPFNTWPAGVLLDYWTRLVYEANVRLMIALQPDMDHHLYLDEDEFEVLTGQEMEVRLRSYLEGGPSLPEDWSPTSKPVPRRNLWASFRNSLQSRWQHNRRAFRIL